MLSEKLQAICDRLTEKQRRKADIARVKAQKEIETIQRESDAYYDGVYDALKALQDAYGGDPDG